MANTYTQIHIHIIIAVQNRKCIIRDHWKEELYQYITGIVQNRGHKMLIINGMPDHIHFAMGLRPVQAISRLMKEMKQASSRWINEKKFCNNDRFAWQAGYSAFSFSKSQLPEVAKYIEQQEEHHKRLTFTEEYKGFLKSQGIEYDERYIFQPVLKD